MSAGLPLPDLPPFAGDLIRMVERCWSVGLRPSAVQLPTSWLRDFGPVVTFYGLPVHWVPAGSAVSIVLEVQ